MLLGEIDESGYRLIPITAELDVTVTPTNVASVWEKDKPAKHIPCVVISYNYSPGDMHEHHAIREGSEAVEFIVTAWIHGRTITNVKLHIHN